MNEEAATRLGEAFLRGFFETIDAMLATGMQAAPGEPESVDETGLAQMLGEYSLAMHGMIEDGGRVGVLLSTADAAAVQAKLLGEDAPESDALGPDEIGRLREVFEPCLGGGAGALKGLLGRELTLTGAEVAQLSGEDAAALLDNLDKQAFAVPFTFSDSEQTAGKGVFIAAQVLFAMVPEAEDAGGGGESGGPRLSQDEMDDILSGFDAGQPSAQTGESAPAAGADVPPNLDMIMDIGLVCTARLGRVEMPISEILTLGPGSILEVGHLVDEPIELLVNDKLIARGDVVVVDEKFGLRITEIVSQADRIKSLL